MLALADLLASATLVAVAVTNCCVLILAGAAYRPVALMVPRLGLMLQFTAVLPGPPVTVAVNCCVCPAERVTAVGLTAIAIGVNTEIEPGCAEIGKELPSAAAAARFPSCTEIVPEAAGDNVTFKVARIPSGIVLLFMPLTRQRAPEHCRDLIPDKPALSVVVTAVMPGALVQSHCSAAGGIPVEDVRVR